MIINLPDTLENDLREFCMMNNIDDINSFVVTCFRNGYYIAKYGISPEDNFKNQNKPFKVRELYEDIGSSNQREQVEEESRIESSTEEKEVEQVEETKKPIKRTRKKSVKIIKN